MPRSAKLHHRAARTNNLLDYHHTAPFEAHSGLRVKMCVWLGVSRGLDLAFLNAD